MGYEFRRYRDVLKTYQGRSEQSGKCYMYYIRYGMHGVVTTYHINL